MMRPAIAPGPTVHWLFRSHDLPSKFSPIVSRMCDRRNRAVKDIYVSPLLETFFVVSAIVPDFIFIEDHTDFKMLVLLHHNANKLFAVRQHVNFENCTFFSLFFFFLFFFRFSFLQVQLTQPSSTSLLMISSGLT